MVKFLLVGVEQLRRRVVREVRGRRGRSRRAQLAHRRQHFEGQRFCRHDTHCAHKRNVLSILLKANASQHTALIT